MYSKRAREREENKEKSHLLRLFIVCVCAHVCVHVVEVRGYPVGIGSFLPPYESQGLNSGSQAWWQMSLPMEASQHPCILKVKTAAMVKQIFVA